MIKSCLRLIIAVVAAVLMCVSQANAACPDTFELTGLVNWNSIFPLKIAGIRIAKGSDKVVTIDTVGSPICVCPAPPPLFYRVGLKISYWEPARLVETVKEPGCFPSMGFKIDVTSGLDLVGSSSSVETTGVASHFAQAHYFMYPIWSILGMLTDFICAEGGGLDVAYMTEFDPLWQDDSMAAILNPEAVLFGNPASQFACIADSIGAAAGLSLSPLFWCMGSWGNPYPMTGHIGNANALTANAGIAARMLYKMARSMLVCDTNIYICGCVPTPIWVKHNYKFQLGLPVKDYSAHPIGRTDFMWGSMMNPPSSTNNFAWVLFRRRTCCAF